MCSSGKLQDTDRVPKLMPASQIWEATCMRWHVATFPLVPARFWSSWMDKGWVLPAKVTAQHSNALLRERGHCAEAHPEDPKERLVQDHSSAKSRHSKDSAKRGKELA